MQKRISFAWLSLFALMAWAALGMIVTGCTTTPPPVAGQPPGAAGAQLWAQNCGHCHNIRSPGSYSDSQWEVVSLHMRVRANLTADEHRQILAFLKSAH